MLPFALGVSVATAAALGVLLRLALRRVHQLEAERRAPDEASARIDWLEEGQQILARFLINRLYPGRIRSPRSR